MSELWAVLAFAAVPLAAALVFAVVLPPLGAGLHLRNESLLGIALPPAGSALLALAAAFGFDGEGGIASFALVAVGLAVLSVLLPPGSGPRRANPRARALLLAAVFCIGNAALLLILALSPQAQARLFHAMNGEMLAVGPTALVVAALAGLVGFGLFLRFRGLVFAYLLDEEVLRVRGAGARRAGFAVSTAAVLAVTGAVLMTGPVLCAGLLLLPALLAERRTQGVVPYFFAAAGIGVAGTLLGFVGALALDWPPAPAAVAGVLIAGLAWRFAPRAARAAS